MRHGTAYGRAATVVALLAATLALGAASPAAAADDSPYIDWPALLPPLPAPYTPNTEPDCANGESSCIDSTIVEMYRRFNTVVPVCDHRNVFSLAYLRVTEDVRDAIRAGSFTDANWLQHEDKVFARMYFNAYDDYAAGRRDRVPIAWQIAFDAATGKQVPALYDFLLAMNAHINRDFPFMLAGIGITKPNGTSRKPDHDAYNRRLAALYQPVLAEVASRFDPTADDVEVGSVDNEAAFFILQSWREGVWRNAERLVNAKTPQERADVARSIEGYSETVGRTLYGLGRDDDQARLARRDAFCAAHGGQDPNSGKTGVGTAASAGKAFLRLKKTGLRLRANRRVAVPLGCPPATAGCRGRVSIVRAGRTLASRRYALGPGINSTVPLTLSRTAAASVTRARSLVVRVRLRHSGVGAAAALPSRRTVLRAG
jgi:hypothetical protein